MKKLALFYLCLLVFATGLLIVNYFLPTTLVLKEDDGEKRIEFPCIPYIKEWKKDFMPLCSMHTDPWICNERRVTIFCITPEKRKEELK